MSSGSALDDILRDRAAVEAYFGIHLDSDESDIDVPDEWDDSEDEQDKSGSESETEDGNYYLYSA